jgi:hypothetical protein
LRHHVTGAALAASALGGYAQLKLDLVEAHASACMAGNLTVRNPAANTDDHDGKQAVWLAVEEEVIVL